MYLDHVALGARDASAQLATVVDQLGALLLAGGRWTGFQSLQVHLGDDTEGMKLELLEPFDIAQNDFLERFLTRHGDGPHHLTFKVENIEAELERVSGAGCTPVAVNLSDPGWKEAFLQPRDAHGTVVQLAESDFPVHSPLEEYTYRLDHGLIEEPKWWHDPPARGAHHAVLRRVVVATPSIDATQEFFGGLLGGEEQARGDGWVELGWHGDGHVRLEERTDRGPGVDRLELTDSGPTREVHVAGTRLVVNP